MAKVISKKNISNVEPWQLPEMNATDESGVERGRTPTEEAGFQAGYQEGLRLAKQQAYDDARLQMSTQFCAEWENKLSLLADVITHLEKPVAQNSHAVENALLHLVEQLVMKLMRAECKINKHRIVNIIREALQLLPEKSQSVTLIVAFEDQQFLAEYLPQEFPDSLLKLQIDSEFNAGDFKIQSEDSSIDGTLITRLDALIAQMSDQQQLVEEPLDAGE